MEPQGGDERPHLPPPSLWPVGFAVGIVCVLVGLVVSWPAVAAGALITFVFGLLWARDVMTEQRRAAAPAPEAERPPGAPPIPAQKGPPAMPEPDEGELARFPRSKFLEGTTLGIGGLIGGIVTLPAVGFAVLPAFTKQGRDEVDLGPITNFPEGDFVETTFLLDPAAGEVSRRTAYIRNNGVGDGKPSFTIISNRCVHLGCPVQASGLRFEERAKTVETETAEVTITPTLPAGFGCPCHGGAYDTEGNRTAGPPVRALDRYKYSIVDGRLLLGETYSVAKVKGEGANAKLKRYGLSGPGEHVDGPESLLYPLQPGDL